MAVSETAKRQWGTAVSDVDDRVIPSCPPGRDGGA